MANDCLITKLKAVVSNDNLPYFNSVVLKYKKGVNSFINTGLAAPDDPFTGTIEILSGDGYCTNADSSQNYGQKHDYTNAQYVILVPATENTELKVKISPKNNIKVLAVSTEAIINDLSIEDFDYCNNLKVFNYTYFAKELSVEKFKTLHLPNLEHITAGNFSGSILDLVQTKLKKIYADGGLLVGDFVSFVNAKRNIGNVTGSVAGRWGINVKLNGHDLPLFNQNCTWDASSIVIKYNKIDNSNAYTYGANLEQVNALTAEGYTVIQCD